MQTKKSPQIFAGQLKDQVDRRKLNIQETCQKKDKVSLFTFTS